MSDRLADDRQDRPPLWKRLPRAFYWIAGAAVSILGAVFTRVVADQLPKEDRIPVWIVGTLVIFLGLWVLSVGSQRRRESPPPDQDGA